MASSILPRAGRCVLLAAATSCEQLRRLQATQDHSAKKRLCSSLPARPYHSHSRRHERWHSDGRSCEVARSSARDHLGCRGCFAAAEHRRRTGATASYAACPSAAGCGASQATAKTTDRRTSTWWMWWEGCGRRREKVRVAGSRLVHLRQDTCNVVAQARMVVVVESDRRRRRIGGN